MSRVLLAAALSLAARRSGFRPPRRRPAPRRNPPIFLEPRDPTTCTYEGV